MDTFRIDNIIRQHYVDVHCEKAYEYNSNVNLRSVHNYLFSIYKKVNYNSILNLQQSVALLPILREWNILIPIKIELGTLGMRFN